MTSAGEVQKVEGMSRIMEKALATLPDDPAASGMLNGLRSGFSDDSIKSTFSQVFSRLPERPVKPGDIWNSDFIANNPMNARVADAGTKVDQMQAAGDTYFAGRGETIKNIQDAELRDRAQQRMAESQKQFAGVLQSLRDANQALGPFRKELADQITYLGSDLTPSAMQSLKPNADKLNTHGADVFSKADKAIAEATAYFQSLKSSAT